MAEAPLVAGIGSATYDLVGVVPRHLEPGARAELEQVSLSGGGAVPTALVASAALGCRARFAGRVAGDDFGRLVRAGLTDAGVDCRLLLAGDGALSPLRFVVVARDDRRRIEYATAGDVPGLGREDLDLAALLDGAAALVLDGAHPELQVAAAEAARARGAKVVVHAGGVRGGLGELVALADVLVASERYVNEVAPRGELEDSLLELAAMGPKAVAVTMGSAGSMGLEGSRLVSRPAHEVDVVDTTGAAGVYLGALVAAIAQGYDFANALELASATAALSCRALGARAGIPERAEVLAYLGWGEAFR